MIKARKEHYYQRIVFLILIVAALVIYAARTYAITPEERGLEIATLSDKQDDGFKDQTAAMKMILRNKQGQEIVREIDLQLLEVPHDGDKSLSIFQTPNDVKGTALLSYTHKEGPDDQWLYLPALKRVKRISSANKSGPFMGSEFAYEDITSQEVEKYTYRFIQEDTVEGVEAYLIERFPVDPKSGYSKQEVWLHKTHYYPLKIEFYDRAGAHLKTLTMGPYQRLNNKYYRTESMDMVNHITGKSTRLEWRDYKLGVGLSEQNFTQNALKRAR